MSDAPRPPHTREILDIVSGSQAPVLVLEIPSQVILAASPSAGELLDDIAQPLVGQRLEDYIEDHPSGAMRLLAAGRITAYESLLVLRTTGQRRRLSIRALPDAVPARAVIAVLLEEDATGRASLPWIYNDGLSPVFGSTDTRLMIERVSGEMHETLGYPAQEMIGSSFLALIAAHDVADVLSALAETARQKEGVTLRVGVVGAELMPVTCQLALLPLIPAPRFAFALLADDLDAGPADGRAIRELITRLRQEIRGAMTSPPVALTPLHTGVDLGHLSSRELEIVALLMAGDRVSTIAKLLFLSDGTIRNHLSSAFGKLGVGTQQELIELLRPPGAPASGS